MTVALILASTSPYRRELLTRLGLPFECHPSGLNEEEFKLDGFGPISLARTLATEKALKLVSAFPLATIIGSDQVVDVDGRILGKPESLEAAVEQLSLLQGRSHRLVTAVCVWHDGQIHTHVDLTTLSMRPIPADAIARYLARDQPLDCCGAYKLESRGITLFDRIESDDHTAIIGLPLIALTTLLKRCGYQIP
jgi:septum formation protein